MRNGAFQTVIRIFVTVRSIPLFVLVERSYQILFALILGLWGRLSRKRKPTDTRSEAHEDILQGPISLSIATA